MRRAAVLLLLCAVACSSYLRPEDVDSLGTRRVRATPERVHAAAIAALNSMGYGVALDRGAVLKSERRLAAIDVSSFVNTSHSHFTDRGGTTMSTTSSQAQFRQFIVELSPEKDGTTRVRVTPKLFSDDTDVSTSAVWDLDAERARWDVFFKELQEAL